MKTRDIRLSESAKLQRTGAIWEAVLITPGTGSSGEYTDELLEAAAQTKAFPAGTKLWFKHPEWRGQQRDKRDQWGVLAEDARWEPGVGLVANVKILAHWVDVVESLAAEGQADLSIYAAAAVNEDTGELLAIIPSPQNSVDIVDYPGRPGSGLAQKIERARESYKPAATSAEEKETLMDEKEKREFAAAIVASVLESLKPVVDFVTNAKTAEEKAAQAQVDDQAIESAVSERFTSYEVAEQAVKDAKLFPKQEAALLADARKGIDVTGAIAEAKEIADEARTVLAEGAKPDDETIFVIGESATKADASDDFGLNLGGSR